MDFSQITCVVIDGLNNGRRRAHMQDLLNSQNITPIFTNGVPGKTHAEGCARAHHEVLSGDYPLPLMVLENDLSLFGLTLSLPQIPDNADIIYLGVSPFGTLPSDIMDFGRRPIHGLTIAEQVDDNWLRIHTMSGAIAVLYVTERGRLRWIEAAEEALASDLAMDTCCAYAMADINVYAPLNPVFYETRTLQRRLKRLTPAQREMWTRTPISPVVEGDIRIGRLGWGEIIVQAVRDGGALKWQMLRGPLKKD